MSMKRHDGKCAGLTLIELLVSISILSVVGGVILLALYSGILVWERAGGYDDKRLEAMLALEELERDARNAFPFYAIAFRGSDSVVAFTGITEEDTGEGRVRRFCEIEYSFDSKASELNRRINAFPPGGGAGEGTAAAVITGVDSVKITYLDPPATPGGPAVWNDAWSSRKRLPSALRIVLEFRGEGGGGPLTILKTIDLPVKTPAEKEDPDEAEGSA